LQNIREKRGALNLELPEKKILFDEHARSRLGLREHRLFDNSSGSIGIT
jgi:exoribonuclease R